MDPTSNLKKQLAIAQQIADNESASQAQIEELAELVIALDRWISKGGFLPESWDEAQHKSIEVSSQCVAMIATSDDNGGNARAERCSLKQGHKGWCTPSYR